MCWWIVFEITLCVFIENIVFPERVGGKGGGNVLFP
jgi:hypothetical protein